MTSNHVLWFIAAICTLIAGFLLWLWGTDPKPPRPVVKKLLGICGGLICIVSSVVIIAVLAVIAKTLLSRIWPSA
jgi:hypothetical protein